MTSEREHPGPDPFVGWVQAAITAHSPGGGPGAVNVAWQCYQQLRSIYHATPASNGPAAAYRNPAHYQARILLTSAARRAA